MDSLYITRCIDTAFLKRISCILVTTLMLSACSMGQLVVRGTQSILDGGIDAMNRETDLQLAGDAMPANLMLLEGLLREDPHNTELRLFAAQGYYGYSYGFIEDEAPARAAQLYRRCYTHARQALARAGITIDPEKATADTLQATLAGAGAGALPALFWSASCLGKWIDLNRDNPVGIAGLSSAAILMQRVLELDENYYYGGAHLFFGVYYGGRSPIFGGDYARAARHFQRAVEINGDKLLLTDLLYAEYLARQQLDRTAFHSRLTRIITAPDNLFPEMALANTIAKQKAQRLLALEDDWF
ncbi:MAG: TRAP transporter TatT component family protein [Gammaproteobacteria bacterium]